jgi:hypothetical protein
MKISAWIKPITRRDQMIFTIIGLFFVALLIQSAATLGILFPLWIDDFVVDSHDNIVVASNFYRRVYYISKDSHLINTISIPESKGIIRMAIDGYDNIYITRLRGVEVYSLKGPLRTYSVALDKTNDWLLEEGYKVTNLNKTMSYEYSSCTTGARRPVKVGEFLFRDIRCDADMGRSFEFSTSTKDYSLSPFWNDNISVSDHQGRFLYKVTITPFCLKVFAFPIPFLGILMIIASAYWILAKIEGLQQKKSI